MDLSSLKTDGIFSYGNVEWGSDQERVEHLLKIQLSIPKEISTDKTIKHYYPKTKIRLYDKLGTDWYEFQNDKLTLVGFDFRSEKPDLLEFSQQVISEFDKLYEPFQDETEVAADEDGNKSLKMVRWLTENEDKSKDTLQVITSLNQEGKSNRVRIVVAHIPASD